ncbi:MAG: hypothetical protein ABI579_04830, partial [Candidatus Sumerlaeota bacterium]
MQQWKTATGKRTNASPEGLDIHLAMRFALIWRVLISSAASIQPGRSFQTAPDPPLAEDPEKKASAFAMPGDPSRILRS